MMKKVKISAGRLMRKHFRFIVILAACLSLAFLGSLSNIVVKYANGGRMPVVADYIIDTDTHFSVSEYEHARFIFLSDWIHVAITSKKMLSFVRYVDFFSLPVVGPEEMTFYISPGDVLIELSIFLSAHILLFRITFSLFRRRQR